MRSRRYPITFEEYDRFASATGRPSPNDQGWGRGRQPAINVSWDDAVEYARWLSEQAGNRYRLPTEAEWEYAARAGTGTDYWWDTEMKSGMANCEGSGSRWDGKQTSPVGSFQPNPFGLYDTAGNVWEWVEDCWHENYKGAPTDGSAWLELYGGDCGQRVMRGGSWSNVPVNLRASIRNRNYAVDCNSNIGFRLAQLIWTRRTGRVHRMDAGWSPEAFEVCRDEAIREAETLNSYCSWKENAMTRSVVRVIIVLVVVLCIFVEGGSSEVVPLLTIPNPAPNLEGPNFGFSIAGVGGNILVGTPFSNADGEDVGIAFLFDGTTGNLLRTISNPDHIAFGGFGWSVAGVDGNLLIGSRGAEKVYLFDGETGALLLAIPNPDPDQGQLSPRFGESVAGLNGNILVGNSAAPAMVDCEGPACVDAGKVYLFDGETGELRLRIPNPDPASNSVDFFGASIAGVGGNILVGAAGDNEGGLFGTGSAYLFDGTTGQLLFMISNPEPAANDNFGQAVAEVNGNILIGAPRNDNDIGAVYLFDGTTGALLLTIPNPHPGGFPPEPARSEKFGFSVSGVGKNILVGSPEDSLLHEIRGAGAVYLFDGTTGRLLMEIPNPDPNFDPLFNFELFGWSVAGLGENLIISAPGHNLGEVRNSGVVYLYNGSAGDSDGDGIPDDKDTCPGTVIPEAVPTQRLGVNRFALTDADGIFNTVAPTGGGPQKVFTIVDTAGCSCEQIIAMLHLGEGHTRFGCSIGAMKEWIGMVTP
jgi:Sulfatase-modifying factor enzyme 1/FG-GAP repeat